METVQRFDVWLVNLNPTKGREINKTRPCIVISPNEILALPTVLMAPMTTKGFDYPCRVSCTFKGKKGLVLLDQIRAIDKSRLVKKVGSIDSRTQVKLCSYLQELFAY
ncbi:MAG: transcriptional regulator [SAR86 cluster bacterium]|uniref:Transcriptional regulator n=1 Tax=SAR86 cluster bacterium TaxID=2030880 RepID=A0A2A5CA50_9GAMM|nr:type II toxin-antitoxin system PemK/MazF family toxin [bacterium AH-315-I11]MBN4075575.1 type II toxin-antitoxin system PemK/MazF family toxin [Gammaproteobacteria bacterium AH-315-E17]PCJ40368.1 MAG: transcriptional regulator [SAR86 cluster bacterium]